MSFREADGVLRCAGGLTALEAAGAALGIGRGLRGNGRARRALLQAAFAATLAVLDISAVLAQGPAAPDTLLEQAHERWRQALIHRDWKAFGELFTEDGLVVMLGAPDVRGRQKLIAFAQQVLAGLDVTELRVTSEAVQVQADSLASEIAHYDETIQPATGAAFRMRGHYVALWRRRDGNWQIHRLIQQVERQP